MDTFMDQSNLSEHERFTFMLYERIQALEETVSILQHESTTSELHGVFRSKCDLNEGDLLIGVLASFMNETLNSSIPSNKSKFDFSKLARTVGEKLISLDIDVTEVVIESDKTSKIQTGNLANMMNNMMNDVFYNSAMYITVRTKERHSIKSLINTLSHVGEHRDFTMTGGWSCMSLLERANVRDRYVWTADADVKTKHVNIPKSYSGNTNVYVGMLAATIALMGGM